jgi:hypothetical protein
MAHVPRRVVSGDTTATGYGAYPHHHSSSSRGGLDYTTSSSAYPAYGNPPSPTHPRGYTPYADPPPPPHHTHTDSSRYTSNTYSSAYSPSVPSSQQGMASDKPERVTCEICGKTFSRAHDRKRHHESQHSSQNVSHKCLHCGKSFSR